MIENLKNSKVGFIQLPTEGEIPDLTLTAFERIKGGAQILFAIDHGARDDAAHQRAMDVLSAICEAVDVPVIGTGDIRRMEDVKKLLYAGCDRVALPGTALDDKALFDEVLGKFGDQRLVALVDPSDAERLETLRSGEGEERFPLPLAAIPAGEMKADAGEFTVSADLLPGKLQAAYAWKDLKTAENGLIPVVVQDYRTDEVLMVAYMNEEAYDKTIETGRMTYYSRSRKELWIKGETSGHYQYVRSLTADCDLDTILAKVKQVGAACHTGNRSCFFNGIAEREQAYKNPQRVLDDVYAVIADRRKNPKEGSYTNYLFDKGIDKILKKCGEEATEIVIAAKNPNDNEIKYEIADFLYHVMVLMVEKGVTWEEVAEELARR